MEPRDLANHKASPKRLQDAPSFKLLKRGKLPKPFHKTGGPRTFATDVIEVSTEHVVVFIWRDGEILTDRAFFGHLLCKLPTGALYPLFEFHWHSSHKGLHAKLPCRTQYDYTNRLLPGAPELALKTPAALDPRNEVDRLRLIATFCDASGIVLGEANSLWNEQQRT